MEDTEYELVSRDEVDRLKKEVERLKSNPFVQNSSEERFYEAISHLNESVNKLYLLFENINKQLMKEYQSGNSPEEKIDKILDQNNSIAEALVSFGTRLDSIQESQAQGLQTQSPLGSIQQAQGFPAQSRGIAQQPVQASFEESLPPIQPQTASIPIQSQPQIGAQKQQQAIQSPQQTIMPQANIPPTPMAPPSPFQQGFSQQQFEQQMRPQQNQQFGQRPSFESRLDINYPVPDRFQPLSVPPSAEPPIDLKPEPPKKKGLFGNLIKG